MRKLSLEDVAVSDLRLDIGVVVIFSLLLAVVAPAALFRPLFEVRTVFEGITIDKKVLTLYELGFGLDSYVPLPVAVFLFCITVVAPLAYAIVLLLIIYLEEEAVDEFRLVPLGQKKWLRFASTLRAWSMTDVMALAMMLFLFTVQSDNTLTALPNRGYAFFAVVSLGFSVFFLRWFAEIRPRADTARSWPGCPRPSATARTTPASRRRAAWAARRCTARLNGSLS